MMGTTEFIILAGAISGGFVSGLSGFGYGLTALPFFLNAIPPVVATPLVVLCSVVAQIQTLPAIWHAIVWSRVLPFILGGLIGVPFGTAFLGHVSLHGFKLLIGYFLIVYCSYMLFRHSTRTVAWGGAIADGVVGLGGGLLGGFAGLSGPLPTIWAGLRGWGKDEKRGVFQPFNLSILMMAAVAQAFGGFMTIEVGRLTLFAFPGTLLGAWLGRKVYGRLRDDHFNKIVLVLLLFSGISIVVSTTLRG